MLRWSGQNANQKVRPDKMPTTEKSHGQNANLGWHFVRLAFCPVGILSYHRRTWVELGMRTGDIFVLKLELSNMYIVQVN